VNSSSPERALALVPGLADDAPVRLAVQEQEPSG
jgi:hypothetical protein